MDGYELAKCIHTGTEWEQPTILMLTSGGGNWTAAELRQAGVARCLNKPVKGSILLNSIMQASGIRIAAADDFPAPSAKEKPLRVLVAEDGKINQVVARRLLESRGHQVALAENGREALEALAREQFDVVLMDVQMPVMNGLEATAEIREREAVEGGYIPIIAMTANAMKGDEETCRAAGMDAYIPKPVRADQLFATLGRFASDAGASVAKEVDEQDPEEELGVFDERRFRENTGNVDLMRELIGFFIAGAKAVIPDLQREIATLRKSLHRFADSLGESK
jgi:CheY-like chemotaxis protein